MDLDPTQGMDACLFILGLCQVADLGWADLSKESYQLS